MNWYLLNFSNFKNYNEADQGLYECTGENDLRVSKIVYSLKDNFDYLNRQPVEMIPIGSSNDFRDSPKLLQINDDSKPSTSTQSINPKKHNDKNRKHPNNKLKPSHHFHHQMKKIKPNDNDELSASILSKFKWVRKQIEAEF